MLAPTTTDGEVTGMVDSTLPRSDSSPPLLVLNPTAIPQADASLCVATDRCIRNHEKHFPRPPTAPDLPRHCPSLAIHKTHTSTNPSKPVKDTPCPDHLSTEILSRTIINACIPLTLQTPTNAGCPWMPCQNLDRISMVELHLWMMLHQQRKYLHSVECMQRALYQPLHYQTQACLERLQRPAAGNK